MDARLSSSTSRSDAAAPGGLDPLLVAMGDLEAVRRGCTSRMVPATEVRYHEYTAMQTTDKPSAPPTPHVPPERQRGTRLPELVAVMERLLADDGCPWDREQTLKTLRPFLVEEAHEVLEAI